MRNFLVFILVVIVANVNVLGDVLLIIDASTYLLLYNYSLPINNKTNYRGAYFCNIIILDTKILGEEALTYHMLVRHVLNTFT